MQATKKYTTKQALVIGNRDAVEIEMLNATGFQVDVASSQIEAAALMSDHTYDMLITLAQAGESPCPDGANKHLALLSDTVSQLLVTDDPQGLVQSLCERIMQTLDCQAFFNFLVTEDRSKLHLNAYAGIPHAVAKSIEWLDYGVAVCGCVARDGARIIAEDIQNIPDPRTELVKGFGIRAYACHPLLAQGSKVIGTLSFGTTTRKHFTRSELDLMKAVADHVANAMERIRLLETERRRAQELEAVLDAVPTIVWISHDRESRVITGNRASSEILRLSPDANASKTAPEGEVPTHFRAMKNGRDIPLDELPVQMAAKGAIIKDYEFELLFDDGATRYVVGNATPLLDAAGNPRGSVAAFSDITERKAAEEREREVDAQKREFYRRTILAATEGKLIIAEKSDIEEITKDVLRVWQVTSKDNIGKVREEFLAELRQTDMEERRIYGFLGCVVEAAANALKHAGGGQARLCRHQESLVFVIEDNGPGIRTLDLPSVALTRHYSTAGTLGMGYKLMIRFADSLYLATGPDGTAVAIQMGIKKPQEPELPAALRLSPHTDTH